MILFINTASAEKIVLILVNEQGAVLVKKSIQAKYKQSEKLLASIKKVLEVKKKKIKNLTGIIVVKGPGSFTALRIGIITANTIAFGLDLPAAGVMNGEVREMIEQGLKILKRSKQFSPVMPEYGREPNIG
ncbi:MAG: tRNA (adenosine(37)-N6)-threonylcarbamoyltransferase complex dimerization subunit type 1 TsaB [Candidatus Kuenenbacteria bacterium]